MVILSKIATNVAPIFLEIIVKILQMEISSNIVPHVVTIPLYQRLLKETNTIKIVFYQYLSRRKIL